ncbi:DNA repair protein rad13 [Hypsizygus marmoreus]|uniref:DNA repair protein rad13 n=1 Tax=Hypsizygus marmoreus TaxID=39966 RepID=A0A369K0X3_HYPMA|nr:DNA repair protein rad13 [Hypsizygus marmoreus]
MGVKSLWSLLTPVGRPILLETVEGKVMAIDSSIWIYQFQATMRDKDGRALVNAHVLGFLRRIAKLLFYGIKPVFVFDGGAPVLKRTTLRERREKKSGAAASHAKIAEKLLAAQMRREALNQADPARVSQTGTSKDKGKQRAVPENDNTVYLEDIDPSMAKTPARKKPATPSSSSKKSKFHDHDPYRLPEVDLEEAVAKATRSAAPDPRLATEDELRAFIEEMRPEDFDVTSPAFRELPTEVQYEIVGDLRLKSRQTSYARLQKMLRHAPTPLDFSKQQIKNLRQRNTLTQQLLITTDSIGSSHLSIPVRIASERNKQYVLMKNEGEGGGWILGIRDEGTQQKPIEIDQDEPEVDEGASDEDMEEVPISGLPAPDPDLREYQQTMALSAIGNRTRMQPSISKPIFKRHPTTQPLFDLDDDDDLMQNVANIANLDEDEDMLAIAIQESLDHAHNVELARRELSLPEAEASTSQSSLDVSLSIDAQPIRRPPSTPTSAREDYPFESPTPLETALSFANTGSLRPRLFPTSQGPSSSLFGRPTLLSASLQSAIPNSRSASFSGVSMDIVHDQGALSPSPSRQRHLPILSAGDGHPHSPITKIPVEQSSDSDDMEEVISADVEHRPDILRTESPKTAAQQPESGSEEIEEVVTSRIVENSRSAESGDTIPLETSISWETAVTSTQETTGSASEITMEPNLASNTQQAVKSTQPPSAPLFSASLEGEEEEQFISWSRSPSPSNELPGEIATPLPPPAIDEWDAAEEMDPQAEEGEYARFISQVKGKKIEDVRREIDDEIESLNQQRKAAMRDSEDVTQQMITQIMAMLRLFGIPYITAPMEAEAQCAELVSLGLVDGVITDDSDVFLFGAQRVFKNMFNQSKTVECFLLSDLSRELGLDRDTLIRLAYLLGSDYVDGLPGVGPVVAMELLKEFPGEGGLHKFKDWWMKVQTGKDTEEDNKSKFRRQFKKKFKDLYLSDDWPNSAVRDAYYHPTVDSSDEPFKWGLPDLDALRAFFREELGWGQAKVDEILLPIIQRMNKRGQTAALNKQSNLGEFFDVSAGSGSYAPRKRQAYTSKRLQNVVDEFRKKRARKSTSPGQISSSESEGESAPSKKRKKPAEASKAKGKARASTSNSTPKKKATARKARGTKKTATNDEDEEFQAEGARESLVEIPPDPLVVARLRPRPKPYRKPQEPETEARDES